MIKSGSPAEAQSIINQYFQADSPYKQNIINDLIRHGLGSEYGVMSYLPQHVMNSFISGNRLDEKEWREWKKANPNLIDISNENILDGIAIDTRFSNFMEGYTGGVNEKTEALAPGMQKMITGAVKYLMYSGTMNQNDAQDYVLSALEDSFHVVNDDDIKLIMPKSEVQDIDVLKSRLQSIIGNGSVLNNLLENYDVEILTSQQLEYLGIFSEEDNKTMYRRIIQEGGRWVQSDDGEGFMLVVDFPNAGAQEPIATKNGEPLVITFEDAKKLYNFDGSILSGTFLENGDVFSSSFWRRMNGKDGAFSSEYYRMESLNQETDKEITSKEKIFKPGD